MTIGSRKRRVCVVGAGFAAVVLVLWVRLVQVQYFHNGRYTALAEKQRVAALTIEPVRGSIFDRSGRPLALNLRRCSVAVRPKEVRNRTLVASVLARELRVRASEVREKLRVRKPYVYVKHLCVLSQDSRDALAKLAGVDIEVKAGRIYPYDSVASKVVGFVGLDNAGMSGIEAAYDASLCGKPGRERAVRNGNYRSDRYYRFVEKKPLDGKHVYLTIDAVVQDIAETELRRAVAEHDARGGCLILMEVETGEILALAEQPAPAAHERASRIDSLWTLRSLCHVYEPGSTFKLVAAAAMLDKAGIAPVDSFDAENGRADLGFATISDPHPHGWLTLEEAFVLSSNVVMAKAARSLQAGDFYGYVQLFGFGTRTGVSLPGESPGKVPAIERWSARTKSTMAFGQEVAVTPLQMLNAYAAIANDGVMLMPRLVKGIVDPSTGEAVCSETVVVRRVVSEETARTLRGFCLRVVEEGTGKLAQVGFMRVAGKTGTAQKAGPRGGYLPGRHVASFVGFAPYERPRLVGLVLLDEPNWSARFGGDSAAPAFARVCRSLASSTSLFDDVIAVETVRSRVSSAGVGAPNFLRMERGAALEAARRTGTNVLCHGDGGRVVAQVPPPGSRLDRDGVVRLLVARGESAQAPSPFVHERRRVEYRQGALASAPPPEGELAAAPSPSRRGAR